MRLYKYLASWEEAKLITAKQSAAIWAFEQNKGCGRARLAFLLLGVFCIGLGIIGLIAANWQQIPDLVKLICCFTLLAVVLSTAYGADTRQKETVFELMLLAGFMMVGATIGLVSQIYHLPADVDKGLLTWAFISLPLVVLSGRLVLPLLWIPVLLGGWPLWQMLEPFFDWWQTMPYAGTLVAGAFFAVLAGAARFVQKTFPEIALSKAVFVWSLFALYLSFIIGDVLIRDEWGASTGVTLVKSLLLMLPFIGVMTYISYATDHLKSFYANVVFGGCYFFSLYLTTFYSLATTGAGLIVSGLLIIGFALMFHKICVVVRAVKGKAFS